MLIKLFIFFILSFLATNRLTAQETLELTLAENTRTNKTESFLPTNPFTRIIRDPNNEMISFDTSFLTFVSADGKQRVTLAAAIHIGDSRYYQELNRRFQKYDAVLYEMVGNNEPRPTSANESGGFIGWLQRLSAIVMKLDFQIGAINYHAENFIHADMTTEEFTNGMKKRGDGFIVWFLRTLGYEMAQPDEPFRQQLEFDRELLKLIFLPNRAKTLRRISVKSLAELDSTIIPTEGKYGSTLIADRNEKALQILRRELNSSKNNIVIFYGAAHLPNFAEKLENEFGMTPEKIEWIQCWKLD